MASIYKRKLSDGAVSWQVLVRQNKRGKEPIKISKNFETLKDAQAFADKVKNDIKYGYYEPKTSATRVTFGEIAEKYLAEITPLKRGGRQETYRIKAIIKLFPKHKVLSGITSADLSAFRDKCLKTLSELTVSHYLSTISHIFTVCIQDWGFNVQNPVARTRKPKLPQGRDRRLLQGELDRIMAATESDTLKVLVPLALETAARQGELAGLTWDMADFKACTITFPMTKNGTARVVPLSPAARALLSSLPRPLVGSGPVFGATAHAVAVAFRRAVSRARAGYEKECTEKGLVPDTKYLVGLRFHDLRHEAISRLFEKGLGIVEVSAISGHKDLKMLKRYTHISPAHLVARLAATSI